MDKIEALIKKLQEAKQELEKASANPKFAPKDIKVKELQGKIDSGTYKPDASKIADKMLKGDKKETEKDAMNAELGKKMAKDEAMMMGEGCSIGDMKMAKNGQWRLDKADAKPADAKAAAPAADPAEPVAPAAAAPAPAPAPAAAAAAPAPKAAAGAGSDSGNSPTKTNTETGGSSPGGASTGGVGSGIGGAGTGGAATGGASTGGAGTVTVTISGSSSTETSSGAGAKKGKGKGGEPAAPITLNISNVGGRTDAGNVASGDGPGAAGEGGSGKGSGGGGGGAAPDEPNNFSTSGKDTPAKSEDVLKFEKNGQWSMHKSAFKELEHKLEGQGKSEKSAGAIAYTVGKEKYGKAGMEAKAKAGEAKKSDDEGIC